MKKILIFAIGLFLSMGTVVAQVKVNRGYGNPSSEAARKSSTKSHGAALAVKYGVKAGVNFSNMSNDMTFDPSFSIGTGFHVGALGDKGLPVVCREQDCGDCSLKSSSQTMQSRVVVAI